MPFAVAKISHELASILRATVAYPSQSKDLIMTSSTNTALAQWALDREIVLSRVINARRDVVFSAWADAKHLPNWFGPAGFEIETKEIDIRVGGLWRFDMIAPNGRRYPNRMQFRRIEPPTLIEIDHGADDTDDPGRFRTTITFDERIASPEMFPEAEMLPHLICSRPIFIGGANDEADQYGSARRVGGCGGRPVCEGRSGRTGSDSRRVCGGNRLSPQACDAAVAGWAGESAKWPAARPADLRSGCARGVDPGLGGIRPDLWQTAAAAATDPGRGPGAARPCSAGTGGAHQITGDERGDDRPGIGRCPAAGGNGNPPPVGSFRGDQAQRAGAHL